MAPTNQKFELLSEMLGENALKIPLYKLLLLEEATMQGLELEDMDENDLLQMQIMLREVHQLILEHKELTADVREQIIANVAKTIKMNPPNTTNQNNKTFSITKKMLGVDPKELPIDKLFNLTAGLMDKVKSKDLSSTTRVTFYMIIDELNDLILDHKNLTSYMKTHIDLYKEHRKN